MTAAARGWLTAASVIVAAAVYSAFHLTSILTAPGGAFTELRTAYWHDQLGYLSIVTDVASGDFSSREPMTETGINHYPRAYYTAVGIVARVTGWEPVTAWNVVSVLLQLAAVIMLAIAMSVLAKRWWVGLLAPLPFLTGTFSASTTGTWFVPLEHHAVLWGPYGVMFSNNAETAGLCIIVIVLAALALAWARSRRPSVRIVTSLASAAALGMLSSFQTYSFLTGMYIVAAIVAVYFLRGGSWWWTVASLVALIAVLVAGPAIADRVGQLATLVVGLLPAAPGLLRGVIVSRGMLAVYAVVAAAAAIPQIAWTLSGILSGDPFLQYRVESNTDLGVVHRETILASLPVALALVVVLGFAWARSHRLAFAAALGTIATWLVLSLNDLWGANAEPYRFWIDLFLLGGVVVSLSAAMLAGADRAGEKHATTALRRAVAVTAVGVTALVYAVSLMDVVSFNADVLMRETWNPSSPRETAIRDAGRSAAGVDPDALVVTDSCIDPRTTKIVTAAPVAYFYLGMAWPENIDPVAEIMSGRLSDDLPAGSLAESNTQWLLTDSACPTTPRTPGTAEAGTFSYRDDTRSGEITLWELSAP